jgi:DNA polymerase I
MYQAIYADRKTFPHIIHLWDDNNGYTSIKDRPYAYRKKRGGKYKSIYGDELEKVVKYHPADLGLFSSDIPPETRFLIDVYGESDEVSVNHRMAAIDIEVDSTKGYPVIKKPQQAITAISLYDELTKHYYCFVLDPDGLVLNRTEEDRIIKSFKSEEGLLMAFLDKWEEIAPTIATGWNIDGFDFPYLLARLTYLFNAETAGRLSPIGVAYFNEYKDKVTIAGVNCLDYYGLYKKYSQKTLPNLRLDTVGKEELKIGKVEYKGSLDELKRTDINKFIEYNLHDVVIVVKLNESLHFIDLAMSICHICHVGYEDFSISSRILEGALLTYLRRKNLVAPNKAVALKGESSTEETSTVVDEEVGEDPMDEFYERDEGVVTVINSTSEESDLDKKFKGAYVKSPVSSRYEWICSADINSLYPSVIMSLNISPETKIGVVPKWNADKFARNAQDKLYFAGEEYTYETLRKELEANNLSISANGVVFDQKKSGCIPDILKQWFDTRKEYKAKTKQASIDKDKKAEVFWKRMDKVQKILLNSLYGVVGMRGFRFYDKDNAEAVTLTGQAIIKTSERFANNKMNKLCKTTDVDYVVAMDTDSLYINFKPAIDVNKVTDPKAFSVKLIKDISDELTSMYTLLLPRMFCSTLNRIVIVPDVVASSAIWTSKKHYAMLKVYSMEFTKDIDELEVKGLDTVRSSYPRVFRDFMKEVLMDILRGTTKKELDKKIIDFKSKMKDFNIEDVAKNTSVRFLSKHETPTDFNPKTRLPFYFVKGSTAQCKAALAYNDMLVKYNCTETEPIMHGAKIKWVYLKENPFGLDKIAFKDDGRDPKVIMDFVSMYADRPRIWEAELQTKLEDFYDALKWNVFSESQAYIDEFYD